MFDFQVLDGTDGGMQSTFPASTVGPLIVGHDRRQHDSTNDERNEQLRDTLAGIAARRASPKREPTGHPGHQEEKRHPPGREEYAKKGRQGATFRVLDAPWNQFIKWHEGVEKNNSQDG